MNKFSSSQDSFLEVVDENNEVLALLPEKEVHLQGLFHRSFVLFLFTREKEIVLIKRTKDKPFAGHFDFFYNHLYPQRSRLGQIKDCILASGLRLPNRIDYLTTFPASLDTNLEFIYVYQSFLNMDKKELSSWKHLWSFSPLDLKSPANLSFLTPLVVSFLKKSWLTFPFS